MQALRHKSPPCAQQARTRDCQSAGARPGPPPTAGLQLQGGLRRLGGVHTARAQGCQESETVDCMQIARLQGLHTSGRCTRLTGGHRQAAGRHAAAQQKRGKQQQQQQDAQRSEGLQVGLSLQSGRGEGGGVEEQLRKMPRGASQAGAAQLHVQPHVTGGPADTCTLHARRAPGGGRTCNVLNRGFRGCCCPVAPAEAASTTAGSAGATSAAAKLLMMLPDGVRNGAEPGSQLPPLPVPLRPATRGERRAPLGSSLLPLFTDGEAAGVRRSAPAASATTAAAAAAACSGAGA